MQNIYLFINVHILVTIVSVLDIKSQYIPEVVVVRRGAIGVLGGWRGGGESTG